jgi:glucose-1-phosphate adenylyltransferase
MTRSVLAVILGGGQGSRLYPLTKLRSKPAVPIAGKYRLVDIPISNCLNSNVKRIFVLTQFNSASLNRHIKNTYHFDAFGDAFVDILAAEQTPASTNWFQGTADAVRQSFHHLENHTFDYVLILSGDQLYQMDFAKMLEVHLQKGADLTIATIPVNAHDATGFGIMKVGEDGMIERFIEKPDAEILPDWVSDVGDDLKQQGRNYLASMGIYIFNRKAMYDLFTNNSTAKDFGKEIIPEAIKTDYKVASYLFDGYWTDIGTIGSFYEANIELTNPLPKFNLYDSDNMIYTRARMLPSSKLSGTTLEKTIVSEGCIISASRIENAVIGIRSRIGSGTTISNSIIMGNDYFQTIEEIEHPGDIPPMGIGERCHITNCIVDKNCRIGNDVRIIGGSHIADGDYGDYSVVDGIVVVQKGAILPNGTVI